MDNKQKHWFHWDMDQIVKELNTNINKGLTWEEAQERELKFGKNELPEGDTVPEWKKIIKHFQDMLIYVLLVAAVITFLLGHYIDTTVILLVVVINAFVGYTQENKAEKALESIKNMLSTSASVLRSEDRVEVPAKDLTIGDVVTLRAGDKIPADIRLFHVENFKVEESPLTGESLPVEKSLHALPVDTVLGDRINMVFSGTAVAAGFAQGVVVEIGENTELGKINKSISEVEEIKTPLLKQTAEFGKMVSIVIVFIAVAMFFYGYFMHDYDTSELLLSVIGLAVAVIPEGLPAILSIILAIGVQTMARENAIVRNLPSVETLGAVSVICSDKTGTLTKNEMTVTTLILNERQYEVTGVGYAPEGNILFNDTEVKPSEDEHLRHFLTCVQTVNDTYLRKNEEDQWVINGEPTEGCLITLAKKAAEPIERYDSIAKIPFDSSYKYMASLIEIDGERYIFVKGAPDRLFDMAFTDEQSDIRSRWEELMIEHARKGERLIGAAYKKVESDQITLDHEHIQSGLQFIGLAGIIDPPREEAIEAVAQCLQAGIKVKMITGDHKETAMAIGKQMGIGDGVRALEGRDLDRMTDDELRQAAVDYDVFARTSPNNKLSLVKALQENNHVTAMTGDGVNDAPALKRADIGVAMGIKGTEVAKDASQMVLVDDNFNTIYKAVREGRKVYDNLKKTILFILPTNGAEGFLILASILLGFSIPLTPVQILWVNMMSSVTISFALAFEKLEASTMLRPPRPANTKLLNNYYIFRIIFVSLLIGGGVLWMNVDLIAKGYDQAVINTVTLHSIVIAQMFHLFNCRSELQFAFNRDFFSNKIAFLVSAILIVIHIGITYLPFANRILGTVPIDAQYWGVPILIGAAVFVIIEIEKWITRSIVNRRGGFQ